MRGQIWIHRPTGAPHNPDWDDREIDVIQFLSRNYAWEILNIRYNPSHVWNIRLDPERGIEHVGLELFEFVLGQPRQQAYPQGPAPVEDETPAEMLVRVEADLNRPVFVDEEEQARVQPLSSFSNILWVGEVVPERLYVPWIVVDHDSGDVIATAPPIEYQLARRRAYGPTGLQTPPSTGSSGRAPGISTARPPTNQANGGVWDSQTVRERTRHFAWDTARDAGPTNGWCFYTANVALVHGWEEVFGQALQSLIWNWAPNVGFTHPKSAVPWMAECFLQGRYL